ncbi:hypothetical protein ACFPK9_09850 [Rubritalea spongiae]|uniref:Uncharacterized protein n=1 Tax=Rubritalea spongiae TaxID=430797 RepID=A0ABW5DZM2_9BACT
MLNQVDGGVFEILVEGETLLFTITDVDARKGDLSAGAERAEGLSFAYKESGAPLLTLIDDRLSEAEALVKFNSVVGPGGSAEDELNALIASDSRDDLNAFIEAVKAETLIDSFAVDFNSNEEVFIVREFEFVDEGQLTIRGTLIDGNSHPFGLGGESENTDEGVESMTYLAP